VAVENFEPERMRPRWPDVIGPVLTRLTHTGTRPTSLESTRGGGPVA